MKTEQDGTRMTRKKNPPRKANSNGFANHMHEFFQYPQDDPGIIRCSCGAWRVWEWESQDWRDLTEQEKRWVARKLRSARKAVMKAFVDRLEK